MNKYSLRFEDKQIEEIFTLEQFKLHCDVIRSICKAVLIIGVLITVLNYSIGNIVTASVFLGITIALIPLFNLAMRTPLALDIFLLIIQAIINFVYPILTYLEVSAGAEKQYCDIQKSYWRASIVICISYSLLINSKYYIKGFVFVMNITLQLILYYLSQDFPFSYQFVVYSVIGCSTAFYHCYLHELGLRSYFLLKQEKIILNNNIMTSIKLPIVCCWLRNEILTLKHVNSLGTQLLKIHNQASFTQFIRMFKWENNTMEQFCYELLNNKTADRDKVHTIKGIHNSQRYACYISFYISENQGILFLNFQNVLKLTQEQLFKSEIEQFRQTLISIQQLSRRYLEQNNQNSLNTIQRNCQLFIIQLYSNLVVFLRPEPLEQVNIKAFIQQNYSYLCNRKVAIRIHIEQDSEVCYSMKYHYYLLFSNLLIQATQKVNNTKEIFIVIASHLDENLNQSILKVMIAYKGKSLDEKSIIITRRILKQIGLTSEFIAPSRRSSQI